MKYGFNNKGVRYVIDDTMYCYNLNEVSGITGISVNKINKAFGNNYTCYVEGFKIVRQSNKYGMCRTGRYEYVGLSLTAYLIIIICALISCPVAYCIMENVLNLVF